MPAHAATAPPAGLAENDRRLGATAIWVATLVARAVRASAIVGTHGAWLPTVHSVFCVHRSCGATRSTTRPSPGRRDPGHPQVRLGGASGARTRSLRIKSTHIRFSNLCTCACLAVTASGQPGYASFAVVSSADPLAGSGRVRLRRGDSRAGCASLRIVTRLEERAGAIASGPRGGLGTWPRPVRSPSFRDPVARVWRSRRPQARKVRLRR